MAFITISDNSPSRLVITLSWERLLITFFVALWLLAFYLMHAGKLVNYISAPVMGGFITGICSTIILMQVPKLMGGTAGTGELLELLEHIEKQQNRSIFHH